MSVLESELFAELQSLSELAFPKKCGYCGRIFDTVEEFLKETERLKKGTGLKLGFDDDDCPIVELYRNCVCGSTLMEFFSDRRDTSPQGPKRRERFAKIMGLLAKRGMPADEARKELLKLMRGGRSEALEKMGLRFKGEGRSPALDRK